MSKYLEKFEYIIFRLNWIPFKDAFRIFPASGESENESVLFYCEPRSKEAALTVLKIVLNKLEIILIDVNAEPISDQRGGRWITSEMLPYCKKRQAFNLKLVGKNRRLDRLMKDTVWNPVFSGIRSFPHV